MQFSQTHLNQSVVTSSNISIPFFLSNTFSKQAEPSLTSLRPSLSPTPIRILRIALPLLSAILHLTALSHRSIQSIGITHIHLRNLDRNLLVVHTLLVILVIETVVVCHDSYLNIPCQVVVVLVFSKKEIREVILSISLQLVKSSTSQSVISSHQMNFQLIRSGIKFIRNFDNVHCYSPLQSLRLHSSGEQSTPQIVTAATRI